MSDQKSTSAPTATSNAADAKQLLTIETWVNNCPDETIDALLNKAFGIQGEYANETEFRVMAIGEAVTMYAKYNANSAVADWERLIAKTQKMHKEFNRTEAIDYLRKTRTGKELEQLASFAEVLKSELS